MTFCLFHLIAIYSQTYVVGHVRGEGGMPVLGASVLLYNDSLLTPPMLAYGTTQQDGTFRIDTKKDKQPYWLVVRSIGYKDYKREVTSGGDDCDIVLSEDNTMLSEVVVKGFYSGVKISGDTIKFDTKHFSNGFENSVSDLLKSLPGVSVGDDGSVSYGGDAINKLLIDGKDLLTKDACGYVLKNMAADLVNGAEIIKNYKEGNIGDRFSQKDLLALNIKTKGIGKIS
ncbi:MAG: carboxypeptidase-like regulatory domain-containing protein [Prevotella sp.]|uniref:carboxypeptidase-like regulatory domain-containing protein n=1 Tax=Prevotella sp. TaxID=59823 RepID=UPI002A327D6E|nr:carboxypeptidase-like regulatory domain-containing protein [Prevotella sp.]MDD7318105.1 carboxypeptidase-like regulatory domain-containing protein [Prevotellaceae bacterium]MDY4021006.1 carboxypeptidase-like regulatory domain-containing protein [Prevotella sp.]